MCGIKGQGTLVWVKRSGNFYVGKFFWSNLMYGKRSKAVYVSKMVRAF